MSGTITRSRYGESRAVLMKGKSGFMNRAASASGAKSMAGIVSGHILKHPVPASFALQ